MSDTVIQIEKLSKRYVIGHRRDTGDALRHRLENFFRNPLKWLLARKRRLQASREDFWALKDVSFDVKQGDSVGIIGRNGAGKSTLLKILSRITEPTEGRVKLKGRVASLLEVGTGFHQELTGRENIFLNGAILGMTRAEICRKFDEIVAFSEIEQFLDTPVKRYSTGMYVRLAFAVAAHLEPEILIVDEVLAVGDAAFQKKCLGKMGEVSKGGRTVLFVSHNMSAVQALCGKGVYLGGGTVKTVGDAETVVDKYLLETASTKHEGFGEPVKMGESMTLLSFNFTPNRVESGEDLGFELLFRAEKQVIFKSLIILIDSAQGMRLALLDLRSREFPYSLRAGNICRVQGIIESVPFVEGEYSVGLTVHAGDFCENVFDLTCFNVNPRHRNNGHVAAAIIYRGQVELDFSARISTSLTTCDSVAPLHG